MPTPPEPLRDEPARPGAEPAPPPRLPHNGPAIAALVLLGASACLLALGFAGLFDYPHVAFAGLAAALLAVCLGAIGLFRRPRKGLAAGAIVLGLLLFSVHWTVWGRAMPPDPRPARCGTNLMSIGTGLVMYSVEHDGLYPEQLHVLVPDGLISLDTLECPSVDEENLSDSHYVEVTDPELREQLADGLVDDRYRCDYFYLASPQEEEGKGVLIACDLRGNHEDGRNVLYADGHVQWCEEDDFQRELDKPANRRFADALREHEGR